MWVLVGCCFQFLNKISWRRTLNLLKMLYNKWEASYIQLTVSLYSYQTNRKGLPKSRQSFFYNEDLINSYSQVYTLLYLLR